VNEPLLQLARKRASEAGYSIDVEVGSAVKLPWPDESMDVCLLIELLEHVADWKSCLAECQRVLKPGGILFLTTSNKLCPIQQEFDLPFYSWYPGPLKRRFERLAVTTRPELVNHAEFPAVNWFTFYGLRKMLRAGNFRCFDRFDMMDCSAKGLGSKTIVSLIRSVAVLRWFAQVATEGTTIAGVKKAGASR
jgi:2-polyprenyl-6-hydroxyphenyl methylase/3-demethylubiquinone-9 3-methyltransferase